MRGIRQTMGLNMTAFARLLGVTPECVSQWHHGRHPVTQPMLKLARYLAADTRLVSLPAPVPLPGPESVGLRLTPASRCDWQEPKCRGPWWHVEARLNHLTHVECTACDHHLKTVYDLVVERLRRRDGRREATGETPRHWRTEAQARTENARRVAARAAMG